MVWFVPRWCLWWAALPSSSPPPAAACCLLLLLLLAVPLPNVCARKKSRPLARSHGQVRAPLFLSCAPALAHTATSTSKDAATNPRGIPYAPFVDKVEDYVTTRTEVEPTLKSFQEMISCVQIAARQSSSHAHTPAAGNTSLWRSTHNVALLA